MLVYGDAEEQVAPLPALGALADTLAAVNAQPPGLARHGATVALFIELAGLAQGLIDHAAPDRDAVSPEQDRLLAALRTLAVAMDASWRSGFAEQPALDAAAIVALAELRWPEAITVRRCEGFAWYGLYPEAVLEAARGLPADTVVIGLRSIGTALAPLVAAAAGSDTMLTVRPRGHPFGRGIVAGPELEAFVRRHAARRFTVVDEGPGLSGSSFGGTADWLEGLGVASERISFLPSHDGDLGREAAPAHRRRWAGADRRVRRFDALFAPGGAVPVEGWFRDITGPLLEPPGDLSGGCWAENRADAVTSPFREARKYRLVGARGRFLAKFVGLDRAAAAKFDRARQLHAAGFAPEPLALRSGFLLERWVEGVLAEEVPAAHLVAYLRFRRDSSPAARAGASLLDLRAMVLRNLSLVDADAVDALATRWSEARVAALEPFVVPMHVDARLHRWEWLRADGRLVKTDAVDHSQAHDLVGCQDILWDVAGAGVEFPGTAAELAHAFADTPQRHEVLAFLRLCYLAFQTGWWSIGATEAGAARSRWYAEQLVAEAAAA